MAVSSRLIKRRIRSVGNTRKITKAMELVAASKMRKSANMTLASRAYSQNASHIVEKIRRLVDPRVHQLMAGKAKAEASLVIVASSDRGLCGGFNAQVMKKTLEFLRSRSERTLRIVTVGKRAEATVRRAGFEIIAAFEAISNAPSFERAKPVADLAYAEFAYGTVDRVFIVFADYRSTISQVPTVNQLLPIIPEEELTDTASEEDEEEEEEEEQQKEEEPPEPNILFEPDARQVLDRLLPRLLETQVYQALLESSASEHSARMLAMRNATESASEMLEDLTFTFNQARQASITREISEISAGKAAIE